MSDWFERALDEATRKAVAKYSFPGHAGRPGQEGGSAPRGEVGGGTSAAGSSPETALRDSKNLRIGNLYSIKVKGQNYFVRANDKAHARQIIRTHFKGQKIWDSEISFNR